MNLGASAISSPQGTGEVSPALLPSAPDPGPFACRGLGDWGCTCHPLSCCSQRLLPRAHTPVPWVPAWPLASIQPSRWLEASSSSPLLPWLPGYRKVGRNPLLHIPPSSTPVGFARTFQPWVRRSFAWCVGYPAMSQAGRRAVEALSQGLETRQAGQS